MGKGTYYDILNKTLIVTDNEHFVVKKKYNYDLE